MRPTAAIKNARPAAVRIAHRAINTATKTYPEKLKFKGNCNQDWS
jgi:hypothetical protein